MRAGTNSRFICRMAFGQIAAAAVVLVVIAAAATTLHGADLAQVDRSLFRYDPFQHAPAAPDRGTLMPVAEHEAKTGCAYSHFSDRLNRRVWAIRLANGQFFDALGEGTSQSVAALDIPWTILMKPENAAKRAQLTKADQKLLKRLNRYNGAVYFRLNQDDTWSLDPNAGHPTVFDAQTKNRWEWTYGRYVPTSSAPFAYRWQVVDGRYVPLADPSSLGIDCPILSDAAP